MAGSRRWFGERKGCLKREPSPDRGRLSPSAKTGLDPSSQPDRLETKAAAIIYCNWWMLPRTTLLAGKRFPTGILVILPALAGEIGTLIDYARPRFADERWPMSSVRRPAREILTKLRLEAEAVAAGEALGEQHHRTADAPGAALTQHGQQRRAGTHGAA